MADCKVGKMHPISFFICKTSNLHLLSPILNSVVNRPVMQELWVTDTRELFRKTAFVAPSQHHLFSKNKQG